jgi:D-glycero-alpha-D-manno-heptose 1-phosphate guanylyltransferase
MITEAIILAGGLGTRLRSAVPELPKCMAPVAGQPFINYVLRFLQAQGIRRFVLALGYKHQVIEAHVQARFAGWEMAFSIEEEPLGTGGAILQAARQIQGRYAVVVNGDTLYRVALQKAGAVLENSNMECVLFAKPMQNADRYGAVEINEHGIIEAFREKQFFAESLINGGVYALNIPAFLRHPFPPQFSFEKNYLEAEVSKGLFFAVPDDGYFIDIGIPEDYERAGRELVGL